MIGLKALLSLCCQVDFMHTGPACTGIERPCACRRNGPSAPRQGTDGCELIDHILTNAIGSIFTRLPWLACQWPHLLVENVCRHPIVGVVGYRFQNASLGKPQSSTPSGIAQEPLVGVRRVVRDRCIAGRSLRTLHHIQRRLNHQCPRIARCVATRVNAGIGQRRICNARACTQACGERLDGLNGMRCAQGNSRRSAA
jgi:hypothetical protein